MVDVSPAAHSSVVVLLLVSCVTAPNPAYSGGGSDSGTVHDSTFTSTPDGEPDGSGTIGDPVVGCGNGILEPGETCDDGDDDNTDGCLTDCTVPSSCLDIFELDPTAEDGEHVIAPYGDRPPWSAWCDMENEVYGGGWTELTLLDLCEGRLDDLVTPIQPAVIYERDSECRPATRDEGGSHSYQWDIDFPPGFTEFYLDDYAIRNNSITGEPLDLGFVQTDWAIPYGFPDGTISLGSATDLGPVAVWFEDGGPQFLFRTQEVALYPRLGEPFEIMQAPSSTLRIAWGETGMNSEGMYPWWEGSIFVR